MKTPASKHSKKSKTKQKQQQNVLFCLFFFFAVVLFQQYPNANIADYSADPGTLR